MASAATAVPVRSKKTKNRPPRSNSSSDTESANSIPDSDDEAGPPIILEDVAPSEKLKTKKVKKTSEKPVEASVEIEAEKKHKKHKKHKTADGEEKPEKHKKKHKERSESPGGTKKSKNKSSKKTKETPEAIVGGKNTDDLYHHS